MERFSIVLSVHDRLSTLNFFLNSIYKNSRFKDHEIVLVADRIDDHCSDDWLDIDNHKGWSIRKWLNEGDWLNKLNVVIHEIGCPAGKEKIYESWNYGVSRATNDWLAVSLGYDFYWGFDWDYNILKHIYEYDHMKNIFVSVWTAIVQFDYQIDVDSEKAGRKFWKADLNLPVRESNLLNFFEKKRKQNFQHYPSGVFLEHCAHRHELLYCPIYIHKDLFKKIGGFKEKSHYAGDLNFDDKLGKIGVMKIGCLDSFFAHCTRIREKGKFIMDC